MVSPRTRELSLPAGVVIDATTWKAAVPERSRLPINSSTGYADVLVAPNGQVVQPLAGRTKAMDPSVKYYHFWITDAEDVTEPNPGLAPNPILPLPPLSTYTPPAPGWVLNANRRLVSINTRTGQITTSTVEQENFLYPGIVSPNYTGLNRELYLGYPYRNSEQGVKTTP